MITFRVAWWSGGGPSRVVLRIIRKGPSVQERPFRRAWSLGDGNAADQNDSRALSWISRPGVAASVMLPKLEVFTKRLGVPRFV